MLNNVTFVANHSGRKLSEVEFK